jgi:hypothetical protein
MLVGRGSGSWIGADRINPQADSYPVQTRVPPCGSLDVLLTAFLRKMAMDIAHHLPRVSIVVVGYPPSTWP